MALGSEAKLKDQIRINYVYDADATYDGTGTMIDMKGYDACCVLVLGAVTTASATHLCTGFKIVSNTTAAGAGTDHDIAECVTTDGGTTKVLTAADFGTAAQSATPGSQMLCLDIKANQMTDGDRYICAVLAGTGTFTCTIVYIQYNGIHNFANMFQATPTAYQYDGNL